VRTPSRSLVIVFIVLAGCTDKSAPGDDDDAGPVVGCDDATLLANPSDPAARGAWPVGARTVKIGPLDVEVWYPAQPGSDVGSTPARYDLRAALPASEAAKIPDADNPWQSCDCVRELPLDDAHGPYPVIVFVHGTAAFRHQSLPIVTHWASRGFVVLAANHPGLYLGDFLGRVCGSQPPPQDLSGDVDNLVAAVADPTGMLAFLAGRVDARRIAVAGHSAGAAQAAASSAKPGVRAVISMAGVQPAVAAPTLEGNLYLGGIVDGIAAWNRVTNAWSDSPTPSRLVGIAAGGHLSFSDLCETRNAAGQDLLQIARAHQVCGAQFAGALFDCDPSHIAGPLAWEIIDYASSAMLEKLLQCRPDPSPPDLRAVYPDIADYRDSP
jgi:fermentation-respiration switch protein FrsA (DUF1100 family)